MTIKFHGDAIWSRLRQLCDREKGRIWAAVPYIGSGAARRLRLKADDTLVCRCDEEMVRAGCVDPREIAAFIRRGVRVHAARNLHAKVFVFSKAVVVGSTNISENSENALIEAAIESTDLPVLRKARGFVQSLTGDAVGLEYAESLIPLYRPPRTQRSKKRGWKRRALAQSAMFAIRLTPIDYDDTDLAADRDARADAETLLDDSKTTRLDTFRWFGAVPKYCRPGARVLQIVRDSSSASVEPPARVISVKRYRPERGKTASIVCVEVQKYLRTRPLMPLAKQLGPSGKALTKLKGAREIRDQALVYELGRVWASSRNLPARAR